MIFVKHVLYESIYEIAKVLFSINFLHTEHKYTPTHRNMYNTYNINTLLHNMEFIPITGTQTQQTNLGKFTLNSFFFVFLIYIHYIEKLSFYTYRTRLVHVTIKKYLLEHTHTQIKHKHKSPHEYNRNYWNWKTLKENLLAHLMW